MKHNRTLLQGEHWQININLRYGVPGYLFVTSTSGETDSFAALPPEAFPELGRFLGLACGAVEAVLQPEKVLTGKFGMVPDFPVHFHVLPLYGWISKAFLATPAYHALQTLNPKGYPVAPDAAELIAFVWREYCFTGKSQVVFDAHEVADRLEAEIKNGLQTPTKPQQQSPPLYMPSPAQDKQIQPIRSQAMSDFAKTPANYAPLTPVSFIDRAAMTYPERIAVIYGETRRTWAETYGRCRQMASALQQAGLKKGDVVGVIAVNTPEIYEAHFGVPMAGMVLNTLNCRLDAGTIGYILEHSKTRALIVDREFAATVREALAGLDNPPLVIDIVDPAAPEGPRLSKLDYEGFLATGDANFASLAPADEWDTISINYTSGTTGRPKGVVYHYRGAYLNALGNVMEWNMEAAPVYLWTLPMFHCNGWCFPWTVAAKAGTNICIRKVKAENIYNAIADEGANYLCGAPIVLSFMVDADADTKRAFSHKVNVMTAAAPPPATVLAKMQEEGFTVTHAYGLTETYGPCISCAWKPEWDALPMGKQANLKARQGVPYVVQEGATVMDPETMQPVPWDGETMGEVMMRGNIAMKGYLDNQEATDEAFAGGWFHTGDLGVVQPDGYIQLRDRAKDIIISGGENISSIEVEGVIHALEAVAAVAVVARPDDKWGETPCAFVELHPGAEISEGEIIAHCRENLAGFKRPKTVIFEDLPKTSTGKIQKVGLRAKAKAL